MTRTSLWFHTGDVRPARRLVAVPVTVLLMAGLLVAPAGFAQTTTGTAQATAQAQTEPQAPVVPPTPSVLQTTPPPEPLVGLPAVETREGAIQLSLNQAIALALQQNLDLASQLYVREQQRLGIQQALGIYAGQRLRVGPREPHPADRAGIAVPGFRTVPARPLGR